MTPASSIVSRAHWARGCLLVVAAAVLAAPALAQWKWRDANGRITVSDLPPPREIADKDILKRPGAQRSAPSEPAAAASFPASAAASAARPSVDKELEARRRAAEQQRQTKAKAEEERLAAVRADNCKRARMHMATLESGQRMARINDKGEREVLDDQTRADEMRRAREVIGSDCRP